MRVDNFRRVKNNASNLRCTQFFISAKCVKKVRLKFEVIWYFIVHRWLELNQYNTQKVVFSLVLQCDEWIGMVGCAREVWGRLVLKGFRLPLRSR